MEKLQLRRLRWIREIVENSRRHPQFIAMFFGTHAYDTDRTRTLRTDGCLADIAHPRAKQLANDIAELMILSDELEWSEKWIDDQTF